MLHGSVQQLEPEDPKFPDRSKCQLCPGVSTATPDWDGLCQRVDMTPVFRDATTFLIAMVARWIEGIAKVGLLALVLRLESLACD